MFWCLHLNPKCCLFVYAFLVLSAFQRTTWHEKSRQINPRIITYSITDSEITSISRPATSHVLLFLHFSKAEKLDVFDRVCVPTRSGKMCNYINFGVKFCKIRKQISHVSFFGPRENHYVCVLVIPSCNTTFPQPQESHTLKPIITSPYISTYTVCHRLQTN